ncbi:YceI family protein [Sphingobacterium rhinopitheci]|uniref:YceI family protein n=1 Tax=Sphingobacterium rhinopitheci TaxID=2781960 RepID=UPI001F5214CD|nr:YceI family protein [Sphingobacterium rhinopitheci]MCI0920004.1 YceI family protein [Sphingobacterium rhinopitheci]
MIRNLLTVLLLFIGTVVFAQNTEQFKINTAKSTVKWSGKKIVGGLTEGTIALERGKLNFSKQQLVSGEIVMNTKSISSDKAPAKLIQHLKNDDFFAVDKFPTASFVITSVSGNLVKGKMTIKGITHDLSFPADITYTKDAVIAKALEVKVNRTKYDVTYKSGSIFSGLGDGAIEDDFILHINLIGEKIN